MRCLLNRRLEPFQLTSDDPGPSLEEESGPLEKQRDERKSGDLGSHFSPVTPSHSLCCRSPRAQLSVKVLVGLL